MEVHEQGNLRLVKAGPLGSYGNNAYLVQDKESGDALLVDAPQDAEQILDALDGGKVVRIVVTHRHPDHWMSIDAVKQATGAPVVCHEDDREPYAAKVDETIADGEEITIGSLIVKAIHTPGHTPGSTCFLVEDRLLSGDTLFPGGPGRTSTNADLQQSIQSITSKLFELPDDTIIHPGHGDDGRIGDSKREYEVFASKDHSADLSGDVNWEES
ncbi:MAG: MBL fold metallo-hydrolase [Chloroflexi bacterium]|nr:MBL fold metallo-hydrolase [Chloroflexota bacterium]